MSTVKTTLTIAAAGLLLALQGCDDKACRAECSDNCDNMKVSVQSWGTAPDGSPVELYTLVNEAKHTTVRLCTYGAIVQSIQVPDRAGKVGEIVLGYDNVAGYVSDPTFQGAGIGRFGNRIGGGTFTIDGVKYNVTQNENGNTLHGGNPGFNKMMWDAESFCGPEGVGVVMHRLSPDGEQGFPGNLDVSIRFTLGTCGSLTIAYEATTDKATPINLTHHMYYNLTGDGSKDILGHILQIDADRMTPVDAKLIPTGEIASVKGTPFDFLQPTAIGLRVNDENEQLKLGGGYDHNFVFTESDGSYKVRATLLDPTSGRVMEILTNEPAVQFYSGNFMSGIPGKGGVPMDFRHGLCLETQHFPDSPNHANFPDTILRPGQTYKSMTSLRFSTR